MKGRYVRRYLNKISVKPVVKNLLKSSINHVDKKSQMLLIILGIPSAQRQLLYSKYCTLSNETAYNMCLRFDNRVDNTDG